MTLLIRVQVQLAARGQQPLRVCPVASSAVESGEREEEEVGAAEESTQRTRKATAPALGKRPLCVASLLQAEFL